MDQQRSETPSVDKLSPEVKAQAMEAGAKFRALANEATSHQQAPTAGTSATTHDGSREALMHNQSAPGKSQEAMSPTDSGKGHTHTQGKQHAHRQQRGRSIER